MSQERSKCEWQEGSGRSSRVGMTEHVVSGLNRQGRRFLSDRILFVSAGIDIIVGLPIILYIMASRSNAVRISAFVSADTKARLEAYVREHGVKRSYLIERALQHHLAALDAIPPDVVIPPVVVVSGASGAKLADTLARKKRGRSSLFFRRNIGEQESCVPRDALPRWNGIPLKLLVAAECPGCGKSPVPFRAKSGSALEPTSGQGSMDSARCRACGRDGAIRIPARADSVPVAGGS
jgi:hypothetical protein